MSNAPSFDLESLLDSLQEKWVSYFRDNQEWLIICTENTKSANGKYRKTIRPSIVLGALTALEPKMSKFLPMLFSLNKDTNVILSALKIEIDVESLKKNTVGKGLESDDITEESEENEFAQDDTESPENLEFHNDLAEFRES